MSTNKAKRERDYQRLNAPGRQLREEERERTSDTRQRSEEQGDAHDRVRPHDPRNEPRNAAGSPGEKPGRETEKDPDRQTGNEPGTEGPLHPEERPHEPLHQPEHGPEIPKEHPMDARWAIPGTRRNAVNQPRESDHAPSHVDYLEPSRKD